MMLITASILALSLVTGAQSGGTSSQRRGSEGDATPRTRSNTTPRQRSSNAEAVNDLKTQMRVLEAELRAIRRESAQERSATASAADLQRLNLIEQREERLETRLDTARARLETAQAREQEIQRRLDNIDSERIVYGGLNREDSERAVRNYLEREMSRARDGVLTAEREVTRLENELDLARRAGDALRRKLRLTAEDIESEIGETEAGTEVTEVRARTETDTDLQVGEPDEDTTLDPVDDTRSAPPR